MWFLDFSSWCILWIGWSSWFLGNIQILTEEFYLSSGLVVFGITSVTHIIWKSCICFQKWRSCHHTCIPLADHNLSEWVLSCWGREIQKWYKSFFTTGIKVQATHAFISVRWLWSKYHMFSGLKKKHKPKSQLTVAQHLRRELFFFFFSVIKTPHKLQEQSHPY